MRLIYLSNSTLPSRMASGLAVMKMCEAFARNGHQVVALTPDREPWNTEDAFTAYGMERVFRLEKLPWPRLRGPAHWFGLRSALRARRLGCDLAYGRCVYSCHAAAALGIPVVFEAHHPLEDARPLTLFLLRKLVHSARLRRLVVISHALKDHFVQRYGMDPDRVTVAHSAADPALAAPAGAAAPIGRPGRLQAGYIGHLYPGKGVEVVAALAEACPWADFHVVGGGDDDVAGWKARTGHLENLTFHGFVPYAETERFRRGCDVLLAPYQAAVQSSGGGDIARWMSPLKVVEYMASGRPVVCSDLPVLREVLVDGETALLCAPGRLEEWAAALERLRDDPALREQLGARARETFLRRHTWEQRAAAVLRGLDPSTASPADAEAGRARVSSSAHAG
jgi:glycosyltransferase involved in cell wall biosynthesis